jgi:hypothetical protein
MFTCRAGRAIALTMQRQVFKQRHVVIMCETTMTRLSGPVEDMLR